jgi:hypothetical protein
MRQPSYICGLGKSWWIYVLQVLKQIMSPSVVITLLIGSTSASVKTQEIHI